MANSVVDVSALHAAIVRDADDAIFSKSLDGIILSWNPAAERIFGWAASEIIGQPITTLIPPDRLAEETHIVATLRSGKKIDHFETQRLRKNQSLVDVEITVSPVFDDAGAVVAASKIVRNITSRKQHEHAVQVLAYHDTLTQLLNRVGLLKKVREQALAWADAPTHIWLLVLDINNFKGFNDVHGSSAADFFLRRMANRLRSMTPANAWVGRISGDRFAMAMFQASDRTPSAQWLADVAGALTRPVSLTDLTVPVHVSMGMAIGVPDDEDVTALLARAESAMREAKSRRRVNEIVQYSQSLHQQETTHHTLIQDLRVAIQERQFFAVFQPLVHAHQLKACHCELLLRWMHPRLGMISPDVFVPLIEKSGMMNAVGDWVFQQALLALTHLPPDVSVAVNVSPSQLRSADLAERWARMAELQGMPPTRLVLEITESEPQSFSPEVRGTLQGLKAAGFSLAIDDFGTGWSTLASLARLEVDMVKLDKSFVERLVDCPRSQALCKAVAGMCQALGIGVTAEGVETAEQFNIIRAYGCETVQGWFFAKAMPMLALLPWLERFNAGEDLEALARVFAAQSDQSADKGLTEDRLFAS